MDYKLLEDAYKFSQIGTLLPPYAIFAWPERGVVVMGDRFEPHWLDGPSLIAQEKDDLLWFLETFEKRR